MAAITETDRPPLDATDKRFTVADLTAFPADLPSGPVDYELDNGRLIAMVPPGDVHGSVQAKIVGYFFIQGEQQGHGIARSEVGIVLWRNPDRVVGADAAFIANRSLPVRRSPEGYLETIPDLVVEVRSKNDTAAYLDRKVEDYFRAGTRMVLVIDPQVRTVAVHRGPKSPEVLDEKAVLTCEEVIPGFRVAVAELLRE